MTSSIDTLKLIEKCTVALLDVAGTTTSINFVTDTLFKYALENCEEYLKKSWDSEHVQENVKLLEATDLEMPTVVTRFKELTEKKSDNKGVKALQGLIYQQGYEKGLLKAHVFEDVPKTIETWAATRKIGIYSTGSKDAQKLLFANTTEGDLTKYIAHYFDQSVGEKTDSASYAKIAKEFSVEPEHVFFITDSFKEAKAANEAGVVAFLIKRADNPEFPAENKFTVISSFAELTDNEQLSAKRKIEESGTVEEPASKILKTEEVPNNDKDKEVVEPIEKDKEPVPVAAEEAKPADVEEKKDAVEKKNVVEEKPEKTETPNSIEEKPVTDDVKVVKDEDSKPIEAVNGDSVEKGDTSTTEKVETPMEVDETPVVKENDVKEVKEETAAAPKEEKSAATQNGEKNGTEDKVVAETNGNDTKSDKAEGKPMETNGVEKTEEENKENETEKKETDDHKEIVVKKLENASETSEVSVEV